MDWNELERLVKEEKKRGNPVARIIVLLKLDSNQITVALSDGMCHMTATAEQMAADPDMRPVKIDIDLALPPYANAAVYFTNKKKSVAKEVKTAAASEKAIKAAEKKTTAALREVDKKHTIQLKRKVGPLSISSFFSLFLAAMFALALPRARF
jgi:hypothetical protein